jgi:hypothetical protein
MLNLLTSLNTFQVDGLVKDVYDIVTEEEFREIQKERAATTFVENDGSFRVYYCLMLVYLDGTGYYDDGMLDDFEEDDEELDDQPTSSKSRRKDYKPEKKSLSTTIESNESFCFQRRRRAECTISCQSIPRTRRLPTIRRATWTMTRMCWSY